MTLNSAMRRTLSWLLLIPGVILVLAGMADLAVGPELADLEPGVTAAEAGPRWYGAIIVALGIAVIGLGAWVGRTTVGRERSNANTSSK